MLTHALRSSGYIHKLQQSHQRTHAREQQHGRREHSDMARRAFGFGNTAISSTSSPVLVTRAITAGISIIITTLTSIPASSATCRRIHRSQLPLKRNVSQEDVQRTQILPQPLRPIHSSLPQSLPHAVPLVPPEHCAAAPCAEVLRTKSIRSWKLAAGSRGALKSSVVLLVVVAEVLRSADITVSGVRARVWKRARARMARKASWSEAQFWPGAQAT